jgi:hypothetical protein
MANTQLSNTYLKPHFDNLIERHNAWHNGSRKMSTQELYGVLASCLSLVETVRQNSMYAQLETELTRRGLSFESTTSIPTRVLRCVFNTQERRLSSFAAVVAIAYRQQVESGDFVGWLNKHGGIDKVRRAFAKKKKVTLSPAQLGDLAKNHLESAPTLAVIPKSNLRNFTAPTNSGFLLNISRINANGDCEVIATSTDSAAVRSALANWGLYVSQQQLTEGQDNSIREGLSALTAALAA